MNGKIGIFLAVFMMVACSERPLEMEVEPSSKPTSIGAHHARTPASLGRRPKTMAAMEVLSAEHQSLIALSDAEAAWLDRNGYPSEAELIGIASADIKMLEASMRDRRDGKSAALVGKRRLQDGDLSGAISAFARGAELGSLYARQELALAELMDSTGLPRDALHETVDQASLTTFVAQMEVAQIMGDHRAKANIARFAGNFDWSTNSRAVLSQVVEFMRQHASDAAVRGVRATGPDLRPNEDEWLQLQVDQGARVGVYGRP